MRRATLGSGRPGRLHSSLRPNACLHKPYTLLVPLVHNVSPAVFVGMQLSRGCAAPDCAAPHWAPGAWGACNATCGGGVAGRSIACMVGNATAAAASCAALELPPSSRACNSVPCVGNAWQARTNNPSIVAAVSTFKWSLYDTSPSLGELPSMAACGVERLQKTLQKWA